MSDEAYLDCAASAPLRAEALAAMLPYLTEHHGNPSGSHAVARRARQGLEESRDMVAEICGADPHGVVFTSGGTEADNLAVRGVTAARGGVPICLATEHHAILDPVVASGGHVVRVRDDGIADFEHLRNLVRSHDDICLVSIMTVNNETGVVQPLGELATMVRDARPDVVIHTDAVQAAHWLDLREVYAHVDAMSLAGHKFGGPKGSGVLIVRDGTELAPQILGGGQEHERRSGTQNVAAAVGFAAALQVTDQRRSVEGARIAAFRATLESVLTEADNVVATVDGTTGVPGICHLTMLGVESEAVLVALEQRGVMAAAASSCASGALQSSHVLGAMGRSDEEAAGALRLSLAFSSTPEEVAHALEVIPDVVLAMSSTGALA
ncbi:MAG: aminotransferase class V-fold PLP-dependent enzyme [Actinomycetota bacterium]|nr:aminotransferase class V-fold PLP-dependent enzyme [Actinomycetota bacterium]